ncbi:two-component system response regulator [Clostridia bacterium]|nr:two-component system response regulator [Clostridia bacterium]
MEKIIYVVDDNDTNLEVCKQILKEKYRVLPFSSAAGMFKLIEKVRPDLILLDVQMPEMDGYEALKLLKEDSATKDIPVIFLTARIGADDEVYGFELGAVDYVVKPFSGPVLMRRIENQIEVDELVKQRTAELERQHRQVMKLKNGLVSVLANIIENRDETTGLHIKRTQRYIELLFDEIQKEKLYTEEIAKWDLDVVIPSAQLHDVGKIAISDLILNKPGKLTNEEFNKIKTHSSEGALIIDEIIRETMSEDGDDSFLSHAKMFAEFHHEKWDGTGYPEGLTGMDIPLQGRIMAVADVYDALVSERPYKKPFTHEAAVKIIKEGSGQHFDPLIVEAFLAIEDKFEAVKEGRA